jgi:hypothetical protein
VLSLPRSEAARRHAGPDADLREWLPGDDSQDFPERVLPFLPLKISNRGAP